MGGKIRNGNIKVYHYDFCGAFSCFFSKILAIPLNMIDLRKHCAFHVGNSASFASTFWQQLLH